MRQYVVFLMVGLVVVSALAAGCTQAAPAPTQAPPAPTKAPPAPTKAVEATKAPAAPTAAPTKPAAPPTAVPTKAVAYPEKGKTITWVVPWAAGGASDVNARVIASSLEKELGVPIQVVNKAGAGTQVGLTEGMAAKPDGYTLTFVNLPTTIFTYLDPERKAAYSRKSFQPVANMVIDPNAIDVKADSPYKTIQDLVQAAKAKPEQLKVGTAGFMTNTHFDLLMFEKVADVRTAIVHFDGGAPATTALMGGHIDATCIVPTNSLAQIKSGQIRILGIMDDQRWKFFPNVPTMEEQGLKLRQVATRSIAVPAGTPKEVVSVLSAATKKALQNPEVLAKMEEMALDVRYMDTEQFTALWDQQEQVAKELMELVRSRQ